jgi:hypothetical protein
MMATVSTPSGRAVLLSLQAALPFQDTPALVARGGKAREDAAEVHLTVAEGAEPRRALRPILEAAIDPAARRGHELRILDVEGRDPLGVELNEAKIVHVLQQHVAGVI